MDEKKYKSVVVIWGAILLILQALALINVVGINPDGYDQLTKLITAFIAVVMIGLVIAYIILALKKKKAGPIIGMIAGVVNIINFNILNFIAGVIFIIYCASILASINKNENEKDKKQEVSENK